MASGHGYRANGPNTWLLRPMQQVKILLAGASTHGQDRRSTSVSTSAHLGRADAARFGRHGRLLTPTGSRPLGNDASSRVRPSHPYLAEIERSFGGSDAPRVNTPVRGDVVDLAARSTDIH